ncbi:hypothetical protein Mp_8g12180 [Marchantia polymorpha subsp. ruderalis]|uniref:Uncharacterized protein n=1 Tax=Marchantia polymorpha TaxID=3197 RepID=A0A2R6WJZ0_MARPO|nr:hypothetical protein MARPO_0083s0099 [Marchantia polymorpha]BBN19625.1 hypothetical protein Mp_8g12180 [Marchantia polymorpha subsp. ruderalis]|eukprot:PTQ34141.1 hypothetical protein MARPO_0083s0099 [Marchantia polymorpha]
MSLLPEELRNPFLSTGSTSSDETSTLSLHQTGKRFLDLIAERNLASFQMRSDFQKVSATIRLQLEPRKTVHSRLIKLKDSPQDGEGQSSYSL